MAAFEYKALDAKGRQQKGVMEADSARQIRQQLRDKGWVPLEVEATVEKKSTAGFLQSRRSISVKDLALLTRQIATLIQAGIPVEETLSAVASQSEKALYSQYDVGCTRKGSRGVYSGRQSGRVSRCLSTVVSFDGGRR